MTAGSELISCTQIPVTAGSLLSGVARRKCNANTVIVECKNYSTDIANEELDQLLGRFDDNRGKFGLITCRQVDNPKVLLARCKDAAVRKRGFMIVLTDDDLVTMLTAKSKLEEEIVAAILYRKYRDLLA